MNCANHAARESTVTCHGCGKAFCDECVVAFEKLFLCADCKRKFLVDVEERPRRPEAPPPAASAAPAPEPKADPAAPTAASTRAPAAGTEKGSALPWIGGATALLFAVFFVFVIVGSLARQYREWSADRTLASAFDRVAETGAALERFHTDTGKYPDDLKALVPKYLTELPADPYGGTLHYATGDSGRRVWSIGPDGTDDHGEAPKDIALLVDLPR
ncbi:MAG TPA: hypothetical protein VMV18_09680 [bacterium]|nr:hypothetical protein [bacterium]